ncbi:UNVERIFIED_CONTAM: hypothetical protein FKN15_038862 [Acipenser sinensis]
MRRNTPFWFWLSNTQEHQSQWNPQRRPAISHSQDANQHSSDCETHSALHAAVLLPDERTFEVVILTLDWQCLGTTTAVATTAIS